MSNEAMKDGERAAFEAWYQKEFPGTEIRVQNLIGTYTRSHVDWCWTGWQARAASPQSGEPVKPQATLVTFDEFVQYGIDHGANVVNGMPWAFMFNGHAVTHETDDLYLIGTPSIPFRRGEVLIATAFGNVRLIQVLQPPTERMSDAAKIDEQTVIEAVKQWFPDRAYQAPFFAKALLADRKAEIERGEGKS